MPTKLRKQKNERRDRFERNYERDLSLAKNWREGNKEKHSKNCRKWNAAHSLEKRKALEKWAAQRQIACIHQTVGKSSARKKGPCLGTKSNKSINKKSKKARNCTRVWSTCKIVQEMLDQRRKSSLNIPKRYRRKGNALLHRAGENVMENVYTNRFLQAFRTRKYLKRKRKNLVAVTRSKLVVRKAIRKRGRFVRKLERRVEKLKEKVNEMLQEGERKGSDSLEAFCGKGEHDANAEPYFHEEAYDFNASSTPDYEKMNESLLGDEEMSYIRVKDIAYPCHGKAIKAILGHKPWPCDSMCLSCIREGEYLERLKRILNQLSNIENAEEMRQYWDDHDVCTHEHLKTDKKQGHPKECYLYGCENDLLFIRQLSVHYPELRKLVRELYRTRRYDWKIMRLECALIAGSKRLIGLARSRKTKVFDDRRILMKEEKVAALPCAKAFHKKMEDIPEFVCASCDTFHYRSEVTKIAVHTNSTNHRKEVRVANRIEVWNRLWKDLLIRSGSIEKDTDEFFLCGGCLESARTGNNHSKRSVFNKLGVDAIPSVLAELNDVETTLIQRAKCFQTVVRLGTISSKVPASDRLHVIKGQVLYYPLPIEESMKELGRVEGRPTHSQVCILVNGVPTKKLVIWQSVVSVNKIRRALRWLKANNPLYSDIDVDTWLDPFWNELEGGDVTKDEMRQVRDYVNHNLRAPGQEDEADLFLAIPRENQEPMLKKVTEGEREYIMDSFTIYPLGQHRPKDSDLDLYQMHRVVAPKLDNRQAVLDLACYPKMYPKGRYGKHEDRDQPVTPADFIRSRLLNIDGRFRRSASYIFSLLWDHELRAISPGIFQTLRCQRVGSLNARGLLEKVAEKDGEVEANLNTIFASKRGTAEYWDKRHKDLGTMVRELGPFTFFVTLSAAEYDWEDMENVLIATNKDVPGIEKMRRGERCAMDPVTTAKHFHHRFLAFLNNVILAKGGGPLGVCKAHFWRREYQARGTSHYHMAIWIEDAPRMGLDDEEVVAQFIRERITCQLPNANTHPLLHRLVVKYQKHNCNSYCWRKRLVNHCWITKCRFSFPRPVRETIVINDAAKTTAKRAAGSSAARLYELTRTELETDINDYNPIILQLWGANVDVQYVGENTGAVCNYITGYITKAEKSSNEALWEEIEKSKSLKDQLYAYAFRKLSNRECGILEAVDYLLGHACFGKSEVIKYISARPPKDRYRNLRPHSEVEHLPEDAPVDMLLQDDWMHTFYPNRPKKLENTCLYDFFKWYDKSNKPSPGLRFINKVRGGVAKRWKPYLISHKVFRGQSDLEKENYCYGLLFMFKPFRNESTELIGEHVKASIAFAEELLHNEYMREHHEKLQGQLRLQEEQEELRKKYVEALERGEDIDDQPDDQPNDEALFGRPAEPLCALDEYEALMNAGKNNDAEELPLEELVLGLNAEQADAYGTITSHMENEPNTPIRLFTSGKGGSGKSYLINALRRWCQNRYETRGISVAIVAPSGIAASHVDGMTVHRMFSFGVQHGSIPPYNELPTEVRKEMEIKLKDLKLLIVDEISMVSNVLLYYVHKRLCEVFREQEDNFFAGKNVIVFGDFTQLPPVKAKPVFEPLSKDELKKSGCIGQSFDLWRLAFNDYIELHESVRQKNDPQFGAVLERVRFQQMDQSDVDFLLSKRIDLPEQKPLIEEVVDHYENVLRQEKDAVCILPTRKMVNLFNTCMLNRQNEEIIELAADDKPKQKVSAAMLKDIKKILEKRKDDVADTAGIEPFLHLCIGARVLLRRNISLEMGLCNGALGTVIGFERTQGKVEFVNITFDNRPQSSSKIGRLSVDFKLTEQVYIVRKQFPLILAYAMTVHKCQGLSFTQLMFDAGNKVFTGKDGFGMSYVGLGRARTSAGLHLINFDPSRVKCNPACVEEINRMRGPNREQLSTNFTLFRGKRDRRWYDEPKEATEQPPKKGKGKKTSATAVEIPKGATKAKKPQKKGKGKKTSESAVEIPKVDAKTKGATEAKKGKEKAAPQKASLRKRKAETREQVPFPKKSKPREDARVEEEATFSPELFAGMHINDAMEICQMEQMPPGMRNPGQVCYSNSAMQSLMALLPFREMCKALPDPKNLVQRYLVSFLKQYEDAELHSSGALLETKWIRLSLANLQYPFGDDHVQQCAFEYIEALLRATRLGHAFAVTKRRKYECGFGGDMHNWTRDQTEENAFIQIHREKDLEFQNLLAPWEVLPDIECEICHERGFVQSSDRIEATGNFLLVWIWKFTDAGQTDRTPIPGFDPDRTMIAGKPYKLMAAIEHIGEGYSSGHYVAYVRRNDQWFMCNDEQVTKTVGNIDASLRDISFLILEKIPTRDPISVRIE